MSSTAGTMRSRDRGEPERFGAAAHQAPWLVWGQEWPEDEALGPMREAACALVPSQVPARLMPPHVRAVFGVTEAFARDAGRRVVFFSDLTRYLHVAGLQWSDVGVADWIETHRAMEALPVPLLFLTVSYRAYAYLCDASVEGITWHYADGTAEHDPSERDRVRAAIKAQLDADWGPYVELLHAAGRVVYHP